LRQCRLSTSSYPPRTEGTVIVKRLADANEAGTKPQGLMTLHPSASTELVKDTPEKPDALLIPLRPEKYTAEVAADQGDRTSINCPGL
jgi:hypothetical protein